MLEVAIRIMLCCSVFPKQRLFLAAFRGARLGCHIANSLGKQDYLSQLQGFTGLLAICKKLQEQGVWRAFQYQFQPSVWRLGKGIIKSIPPVLQEKRTK